MIACYYRAKCYQAKQKVSDNNIIIHAGLEIYFYKYSLPVSDGQ